MRSRTAGLFFSALCLCPGFSLSPPAPNPSPVQAEILAPLRVSRLENGAKVLARVTRDWDSPDCLLRTGSILEATVEIADVRKGHGESRLALSFSRAQCNGSDLKPMNLLLAAVSAPPAVWDNVPDAVFKMPVMFMNPNGTTGFGGAGIGGFSLTHLELRGINHRFPMGPNVHPGAVLDIRGMKLDLGTGPNRSSILTTKNRDVTLDAFTQLLLVPSSVVFSLATGPSVLSNDTTAIANAPPPPSASSIATRRNDLEICAPPGCTVDLPASAKELGQSAASIAVGPLGYAPRLNRVLGEFTDEEALAWLGPRQLLFAFNRHSLIRRAPEAQNPGSLRRVIRTVLIDMQSRTVARAVDWEITDNRRYLWPLAGGRVLAHVGNELRVYSAGLAVEQTIPLAGSLAFVRISPNGELLAVATLHERHSQTLHARLRDEFGGEPEEDVDVSILDKNFHTIAQASTVSGLQPPTLLNEGQVNLLAQPNMHYRLALSTWENKATTLARFASRCIPELSSVAPNLLFLLSCNVATGRTQYRVLGADGQLLLRGEAGPREVGHQVSGNQVSAVFAFKVVHAFRDLAPGVDFKATDLESQEIRVYRAGDGKRLMVAHVNGPVASHDNYALSPEGTQLAVLSGSQIQLFPVPTD